MNNKPIKLDKELETKLVSDLQTYFELNLEPVTQLQAYLLLDFILKTIGPEVYNVALEEAYAYLQTQLDDLFILQKTTE